MMREYLLDTHTLLWYLAGDKQLPTKAKDLIENKENLILFSIVSFWEIALKIQIGKLILPLPFENLKNKLKEEDIDILFLQMEDIEMVLEFPFHHKDPFDRVIIAQARNLNIPVIGKDEVFKKYGISLIW